MSTSDDEAVGYGRPPKHARFKPGQSGNPNGRPAGAKGFSQSVKAMLNERIPVRGKDGRTRSLRTREAMLLALREQGFKGNMRALERLLDMAQREEEIEEAKAFQARRQEISAEDKAMILWGLELLSPIVKKADPS